MVSGKDIFAFLLGVCVMLGPLVAATYGAQHAPPETVKASGAVPPGVETPPDKK